MRSGRHRGRMMSTVTAVSAERTNTNQRASGPVRSQRLEISIKQRLQRSNKYSFYLMTIVTSLIGHI